MSDESTRTSAGRRYVLTVLKLVVSVALLAFLFSRIDTARLWDSAWQNGNGNRTMTVKALTQPALIGCYKKKSFLESYWLTQIAPHLKNLPAQPGAGGAAPRGARKGAAPRRGRHGRPK